MKKDFKNVYILATEDGQEGVIETLAKWGGNRNRWYDIDVRKGEIWLINKSGDITYIESSKVCFLTATQIYVGQELQSCAKWKPSYDDLWRANGELKEDVIRWKTSCETLTEETERLKRIISELNNQIKAQAERNIRQQNANKDLQTLCNNLKWESEKKSEKLPMYRGDELRHKEVIKALKDAGGINTFNVLGHIDTNYYYIGESNIIRFTGFETTHWLLEQIFELKELPPKKIELVEGEFYKCKNTSNDVSIYIYKNVNKYDTSYLCGINANGDFTKNSNNYFGSIDNIIPATQEQKEILLKRINDEGYVYNKEMVTLEKKKTIIQFTLSAENYDRIVCRDRNSQKWMCSIFGDEDWTQTLPFNEETKKLIGTTNTPDKEYRYIP